MLSLLHGWLCVRRLVAAAKRYLTAPRRGTPVPDVRLGATPFVSATTDANGWVTYTGDAASGRVTAPLGATRCWFSLAGGEIPGPRELIVSAEPKPRTRFTCDGSAVTETSPRRRSRRDGCVK